MGADRPLRLEYLDPDQLDAHPSNWKFHPPEQLGALGDFLADVGWAGALLYNESTGRLLDGHGRRDLCRGKGEPVPVLVGRWTESQEKKVLALLDPTGWMARTDAAALDLLAGGDGLLTQLAGDSDALRGLLDALKASGELFSRDRDADASGPAPPDADADAETKAEATPKRPAAADVPDALWPTDNPWGVPSLDLTMQADAVEYPVTIWGSQSQTRAMRGTWAFYTADDSFSTLWANPGKPLPSGAPCLIEPNYSTHDQTPFACDLYGLYKKRWLARFWQGRGRRIFVDINVHHRLLADHEATPGYAPAFLGVPRGWRAFASRAHADRPEMLAAEHDAALAHSGLGSILFLVYGGGVRVRDLCRNRGWAWVPEQSDTARGRYLNHGDRSQPAPLEVDRAEPGRPAVAAAQSGADVEVRRG